MKRRNLFFQIFAPYLILIFLSLIVVSWLASRALKHYHVDQAISDLEAKAALTRKIVGVSFDRRDTKEIGALCKEAGNAVLTRITVMDTAGNVICDSDADPASMENHLGRPEVKKAMTGNLGVDVHFSKEMSREMIYVALPIKRDGAVNGVIRASKPLTHVTEALDAMYRKIATGGLVVAAIAVLMGLFITRQIVRPLEAVKAGAERYAKGDFEYRLRSFGAVEISALADTLNKMALQLMRLETMRQDFVANVSHELMTPITSIKGFVETLRDGAVGDPKRAKEFLEIILKHADRLGTIVEDLLSLSRLEQGVEKGRIKFEKAHLQLVLKDAVALCEQRAREKDIAIELEIEEDVVMEVNAPLLEEAVMNLVDNAVKYSGKNAIVSVRFGRADGKAFIRVIDRGCGIPPEHLSRIFERFYRVDKARSREMGGTGLGLSIVKHIVSAHGGHVFVESEPGRGSTFSIYLPIS